MHKYLHNENSTFHKLARLSDIAAGYLLEYVEQPT